MRLKTMIFLWEEDADENNEKQIVSLYIYRKKSCHNQF